ncbi:MAG: amino acid adenylation domain-containing protein, partial [Burkholderiales bacterium]|nr:amino acid adenylation domain-containing protein [Burkholderiales bacterium]
MNANQYSSDDYANAVAIIGMSGRFPDADNLDTFWANIRNGLDAVQPLSDDELLQAGVSADMLADKDYVKVASELKGIELFDAGFFGVTPREAQAMDPQHRLFMECAWHALEHAGYDPHAYPGAIGLYAGTALSAYLFGNILPNAAYVASADTRQLQMVNDKDFLCGRIAFELDLRGPAVTVQTACSTSLVAVHMACQAVLSGECEMALAGGVSIQAMQKRGYRYVEGGLLSADGHCRAFDANATGIITGNGLGIVVLKTLANAIADGDTVHAIIRGSAINNDGRDKASFAAPSIDGQAAAILEAQAVSGIDAASISYIEAHGTGTMLGDPIEVGALRQAFGASTSRKQFCAIGSLKSNVGHLDVAAGVAGLIKTVLALKHKEIPPTLHVTEPNPHIGFDSSPFFVNTQLRPWSDAAAPRRAGVSSFGIGGTNAHVIVEEACLPASPLPSRDAQLLVLSARTPAALDQATANLADFLAGAPDTNLADLAYTLQRGRHHFNTRRSLSCANVQEAIAALRAPTPAQRSEAGAEPPIVFMFPGGGTQYVGMARALYESEALFRGIVDECATLLLPTLGHDLREVLFPTPEQEAAAAALINQTHFTLTALFTVEYGLAKQLNAWGIHASAMVGHSLGEYVAACLAGVFTLKDALKIVEARGRLIASQPTANMLAALATPADILPKLTQDTWLACVNGAQACTISGTPEATEALALRLESEGVDYQLLRTWPASHSGLMEPILARFRAVFAGVELRQPKQPYLSNLSGDWITPEQATSPEYWVSHLRETVQFAGCLAKLRQNPANVYVEVGPGHTLVNLLKRDFTGTTPPATVTCLPRQNAGGSSLLSVIGALGQLWTRGARIDWDAFRADESRRRIPLPGYPFERKRYWIDPPSGVQVLAEGTVSPAWQDGEPADDASAPAADSASTLQARPALEIEFVAPTTETEQTLCAEWERLLGVSPIGVHDHFFQLGGSSLSAIQLTSRIRAALSVELPLRALFETPTVAAQALEIERRRNAASDAADTIAPRAASDRIPLSFSQQRVWIVDRLDARAGAAYHIPKALRMQGALDKSALKAALDRIVARHESLRTVFAEVDGEPVQVVNAPNVGFALAEHDISHAVGQEREFMLKTIAADEAAQAFDLAAGPLIRGQLLRLGEDDHVLLITQHHIVTDGWSIGILVQELSALYQAFTRGQPDPLPALHLQYADYAVWQRRHLQGAVMEREEAFWKSYLGGAPHLLELPTDRPRPAIHDYQGDSVALRLAPALSAALRAFSQRHGATLFMTLLAGWSLVLARLSGQDDIVVGTPVANRQHGEVESLIGFFVNTLALRVAIDPDASVADLMAGIKAGTLSAYEHQDMPFDRVVEALQPVRSTSHSPIFQVMLNLHNTPSDSDLEMAGLKLSAIAESATTSQFDMMLSLVDCSEGIIGEISFAQQLFDVATIERVASLLQTVMARMVEYEDAKVHELIDLDGDARQQVLYRFNDTQRAFPDETLPHQLFEAHAATAPDATALLFESTQLSYDALNRRANQVAHRLIAMGVQPDDRVALCAERGIDTIVGLLGILKAGGAYLPLDPSYPVNRLAYMLADSAPVAIVTPSAMQESFAAQAAPLLLLDDPSLQAHAETNPDAASLGLHAGHVAYVIYTSGSTGRPKGVMVEHRGLCNLALLQIDAFGLGAGSRVLQFASPGFDASIWEVVMGLCSGAALCLAPRDALWPGEPLAQTLAQHAVTHVTLPPSILAALEDPNRFAPMTVVVAGEACPPTLAQKWSARHAFYNAYGPTEATVCSSFHRCGGDEQGSVPIGQPVANARMYILDERLQPVPIGVRGEIYIGGVGIARGYLGRPELTAESFLDDPFQPGARLYKSGDLGRWLPDGSVEYLGRNDFQVKIRGFRIELGEIEHQLGACPGVRDAIVLGREDLPGDKRIVAYVTPQDGATLSAAALRTALSASLAEYMLPSAFVVMSAFPLTPNGKVDRKALPIPDSDAAAQRSYEAPKGSIEEAIAAMWQDILHLPRVGRHDHFFELGGHSLMVAQFITRVREKFGVTLPLFNVYQTPTVAALAEII